MGTSPNDCDDNLKFQVSDSSDQEKYCSPMLGGTLPGGTEDKVWGSGLEHFNYYQRQFTTRGYLFMTYMTKPGSGGDKFWMKIQGEKYAGW